MSIFKVVYVSGQWQSGNPGSPWSEAACLTLRSSQCCRLTLRGGGVVMCLQINQHIGRVAASISSTVFAHSHSFTHHFHFAASTSSKMLSRTERRCRRLLQGETGHQVTWAEQNNTHQPWTDKCWICCQKTVNSLMTQLQLCSTLLSLVPDSSFSITFQFLLNFERWRHSKRLRETAVTPFSLMENLLLRLRREERRSTTWSQRPNTQASGRHWHTTVCFLAYQLWIKWI